MKHSYNQKTGKYYSCKIRNVNLYLNDNEEQVWNKLNFDTYSQRIEYLINFYIIHNRLLALLVKKLQIFVKKILIEKYNFN
ncbi:MAG: hypothetical protein CXB60_09575 [Spiroplasma poulsonii]|nr:hypothetical protein [Spiroplasma poulsonii]